jgi:cephalosporin hydroxylase
MKITIDTKAGTLTGEDGQALDLFSAASFEHIARLWVDIGWVRKYSYAFSWMGRPIIQLPDDMVRAQEAIYATRPDVIVETGVAHGGSLVFYGSLFEAMGHGRVIGVDIEIRPHNRAAIEAHPIFPRISLVEGSSVAPETLRQVRSMIQPGERVMVILDSNHSRDHVAAELASYAELVSPGCFLLVQDGIMEHVAGMPRTGADWSWNNPKPAIAAFLEANADFERATLPRPFDESQAVPDCTHHPDGWLRRRA